MRRRKEKKIKNPTLLQGGFTGCGSSQAFPAGATITGGSEGWNETALLKDAYRNFWDKEAVLGLPYAPLFSPRSSLLAHFSFFFLACQIITYCLPLFAFGFNPRLL